MWQHRWAVWSGVLGATASCLAKLAVVSEESPLTRMVQKQVCHRFFFVQQQEPQYQVDLDDILVGMVYKALGDLMILYGINGMKGFQILRTKIIEPIILALNLFEIDGCHTVLLIPRILLFVGMLLLNAYMIASFLKGMNESGSVVGTALSSASNFTCSAIFGYFVWNERFAAAWWFGFVSVLTGVLLLSTVQTPEHSTSATSSNSSNSGSSGSRKSIHKKEPENQPSGRSNLPLWPPPKYESSSNNSTPPKPSSTLGQYGSNAATAAVVTPSPVRSQTKQGPSTLVLAKTPMRTSLIDRTFTNQCPLCQGQLFDEQTGKSKMAIADLSPHCFHVIHAKCLKQQQQHASSDKASSKTCPVCDKSIHVWSVSKQAAQFAAFWMARVETCLQTLKPPTDEHGAVRPLPACELRDRLHKDKTLTETQKRYIDETKGGLLGALEWGGGIDHNKSFIGHLGWSKCLRTKGIWKYDSKHDDVWLWEWGDVHPRQRCDQCQFVKRPLPIQCQGCKGSCENAFYCSDACQKRDWQRHKMTCRQWQTKGPNNQ